MKDHSKTKYEGHDWNLLGYTIANIGTCLVGGISLMHIIMGTPHQYQFQDLLTENERSEVIEFYRPRGDGAYIRNFEIVDPTLGE